MCVTLRCLTSVKAEGHGTRLNQKLHDQDKAIMKKEAFVKSYDATEPQYLEQMHCGSVINQIFQHPTLHHL